MQTNAVHIRWNNWCGQFTIWNNVFFLKSHKLSNTKGCINRCSLVTWVQTVLVKKKAANIWNTEPQNIVHSSSWCETSSFSSLHLFPAELESSHGCRADERFLPCGGVVQPTRWFLPAHPVSRTGRNETQRCADGLADTMGTGPGHLSEEELHR